MIPAVGAVAAVAVIVLGASVWDAAGAAMAGAAIAAAMRVLAGDSAVSQVGAGVASLLAVVVIVEHVGLERPLVVAFVAIAAMCWTFAELGRVTSTPIVAILPATVAAFLEPGCVALVALAATRLVTAPRASNHPAQPWVIAVPIAGGLVVVLAIVAGAAHGGALATLGARWYGTPVRSITAASSIELLGGALGPLAAVAALAGLVMLVRAQLANLAIGACVLGALLVDLRAGATGPTTLGLAGLCAGLAVGRLAGMIRIPSGQTLTAAACAVMLLLPPAWTAISRAH